MLSVLPHLTWADNLARLAVAAGLGGAIGFERELREREAGLRTHILVCVGSALFTIVSAYGFSGFLESGDQVIFAHKITLKQQFAQQSGRLLLIL